ncbi:MAG TPA: hypothetical protein VLT34_11965, partial [Arthrobacter sp.]|nr:hypothetical protein [Arthrobacter sp.]
TALAKYSFGVTDKNMLFAAGVVGILVATVVRFFAYRFLVFNKKLDEEPEFSHDHEIIERHPHTHPGPVVGTAVKNRTAQSHTAENRTAESRPAESLAARDPDLPGPSA